MKWMLSRFWICVCYVDLLQCVGVYPCQRYIPPCVCDWFMLTDELFSSNNRVPSTCLVTIWFLGECPEWHICPTIMSFSMPLGMTNSHCLKLILPWATHMPQSSCAIWIYEMLHNCVFLNASWSCGLAFCQKLILPYITRMPESSFCHVESTKLYTIVSIPMLPWSCGVAISRKVILSCITGMPESSSCNMESMKWCTILALPVLPGHVE